MTKSTHYFNTSVNVQGNVSIANALSVTGNVSITGNTAFTGNVSGNVAVLITANVTTANITTLFSPNATFTVSNTGNAAVTGVLTVNAISANSTTGSNNQILYSNGSTTYWANNAVGSNTQIQFNDSGYANGSADLAYHKSNTTLITNNAIIQGNLTVQGTVTSVNSLALSNVFIILNEDQSPSTAPDLNAGISVNRGSAANVQFMWDENNDRWSTNGQSIAVTNIVASGSANGITTLDTGNTNITGFANVSGNINGNTLTIQTTTANSSGIFTSSVNAASLTSGVTTVANTTGMYAPTLSIGNTIIGNSTGVFVGNSSVNVSAFAITGNSTVATVTITTSGIVGGNSTVTNAPTVNLANSSGNTIVRTTSLTLSNSSAQFFGVNTSQVTLGGAVALSANGSTGSAGQVLLSSATGVYWANNNTVAGSNTHVQYNDSGVTNASAAFTFDKASNTLAVSNAVSVGNTTNFFVANTTGTLVNQIGLNVRNANLTVSNASTTFATMSNTTLVLGSATLAYSITANGSTGSAGQVLTSSGTGTYWSSAAINVASQYAWTNVHTFAANVNFDSGALFVDGTNNRVGVNTASPSNALTVVGDAAAGNTTITGFVNASVSLSVGSSFTANTTGAYHSGTINAASHTIGTTLIANTTGVYHTGTVNAASHTIGTTLVANTLGVYHTGTVNAASHTIGTTLVANTLGVYHTGIVNAASHTSTNFTANSTGVYHTGTINAASHTTSGVIANTSGVYPTSNSVGTALGATTARWVVTGNSATFTGDVTAGTSDKRLKENVKPITDALEKVKQLTGIIYDYTEEGIRLGVSSKRYNDVGLFAQDVENVLPQATAPAPFDIDENGNSKTGQNYLTIKYEKVVPLLVEAIKELEERLTRLEK